MLILIILYSLLAVTASRPVAGHLAWSWVRNNNERGYCRRKQRPDGEMWVLALVVALVICAIWPLALAWVTAGRVITVGEERQVVNAVRAEEAERKQVDAEREVRRLQTEIDTLVKS